LPRFSIDQRTRAGFLFYRVMKYVKPPLTIAQQIQTLKVRGLNIEDEVRASRYLSFISLYRLRAYTYTYQDNKDTSHTFFPGITFDRVLKTYLFDRKLRLLVFDAIERIEIALNQMGFPKKWDHEQLWTNIKE